MKVATSVTYRGPYCFSLTFQILRNTLIFQDFEAGMDIRASSSQVILHLRYQMIQVAGPYELTHIFQQEGLDGLLIQKLQLE